ncbi:hypothetical protein V8E54_008831 [Elaphomyces granulatus]
MSLQSPSVGWLRCNRNDDRDEDESDNRHAADCIYTDSLVGRHLNRIVPRIIHPALQKIRDSSGEQYEDAQYKRATRCLPISTGIGPDIYIDWSRDGWKKQEKLEMDEDDGLDNEH